MAKGRLHNKVAIITGSTQGIGEGIALGYAREGAKVIVCGRSAEKGQRVVQAITDEGGAARFIRFDLGDEQSVIGLFEQAVAHFGDLNIVVHNAQPTEHTGGGGYDEKLDNLVGELTTQAWRKTTLPTFDGMFWVMREAVNTLKRRGGGAIVNMSSLVSVQGVVGADIHTATKGAMNALTRSIAVEYAPTIRCNAIVAGLVVTPAAKAYMEDPVSGPQLVKCVLSSRLAYPEDILGAAVFLASDEEAFYVTGQCLVVDGGMSIKMGLPAIVSGENE